MVLKLRVECVRGRFLEETCVRVIAMDESASLCDLHEAIQDAVSFDRDHPFDFYIANSNSPFAKREWIGGMQDWDEKEDVLAETRLADLWPLDAKRRKKLYYWFDFGDDWMFEIRKQKTTKAEEALSCPAVLERIGPDPEQYPRWDE